MYVIMHLQSFAVSAQINFSTHILHGNIAARNLRVQVSFVLDNCSYACHCHIS